MTPDTDIEMLIQEAESMLNMPWVNPSQPFTYALDILRRTIARLKERDINLQMAVEFGYRRCEQGHNIEATLSEYAALQAPSPRSLK